MHLADAVFDQSDLYLQANLVCCCVLSSPSGALENGVEEEQDEGLTSGDLSLEGSPADSTDPENLSVKDKEQSSSHGGSLTRV